MRTQPNIDDLFVCAFCDYRSKLDLTECPGCGRLKSKAKTEDTRLAENLEKATPFRASAGFFAAPFDEFCFNECEFCHYQTRRALRECPECGREKFFKTAVKREEVKVFDAAEDHRIRKKEQFWEDVLTTAVTTAFVQSLFHLAQKTGHFSPDIERGAVFLLSALISAAFVFGLRALLRFGLF